MTWIWKVPGESGLHPAGALAEGAIDWLTP